MEFIFYFFRLESMSLHEYFSHVVFVDEAHEEKKIWGRNVRNGIVVGGSY